MAALFSNIFDYFSTHKKSFWCVFIIAFLLVSFGASRIKFENDINKMIPHDQNIEAMNNILNHTKTGEQIIFSFKFKDTSLINPDSLILAQQQFEAKLAVLSPNYIKSINSIQDESKEQEFINLTINYLPLFLEDKDYNYLDSICNANDLMPHFEQLHKLLLTPAGLVSKNFASIDPLNMMPLAFNKLQALNFDPNYELYNGYIFNNKLQKLNFFVTPTYGSGETGKNKIFLNKLEEIIHQFQIENPNIEILYFGGVAVAVGNAIQMQNDTILTLSLTIALLLSLTFYVFKRKRISLIIIIPVIFGALFGLSITAILQEQVSIIAIGAGAIILGIAVDFSVHFMNHTRYENNIRNTVKSLSTPLTLGAITTIGAFFVLRYANAPLLQDLGTFAAFSLLGASLFTLILLPHITPKAKASSKETLIDKLAYFKPEGNKWLLLFVIVATPIMWHFSKKVSFDSDLMKLNFMSASLKKAEQAFNTENAYALSSIFVLTEGKTENEALQIQEKNKAIFEKLQNEGAIKKAIIPSNILPSTQSQLAKIDQWNKFWSIERVNKLTNNIKIAANKAGFSNDAFDDFKTTITKTYLPFDTATSNFLKSLLPSSFAQKNNSYFSIATLKIAPGKRAEVLNTLKSSSELTATDRQSVSERLLDLLKQDFNKLLLFSGGLVFLALLIAYGRIELALISFLPMAISWIWITGLMSILGLQFNVVNIVIATLLFGLGDDYSIFMMDSLMEKYRTGKNHIKMARSAVYLSVLTTITGLGTLIFAKHPALQSIAIIAVVGLICVVFISQVLQPFLFNFFIQNRANKGFMPFTLISFLKSVIAFLYFVLGCILVSIAGFFLIKLNILGKKRGKYLFHIFLSKYTGSVLKIFHHFKLRIKKDEAINFKQPAIYIANHSSFLDILFMTMLYPKVVLLTNKWVYRSPVFGAVVRMAEYYPVADGAEESIEPLRDLVARGYSIMVFPEGTRSKSDKIARFHKGAFYIADILKLNIVPVLLHGLHYTLQKGDFLIKKGNSFTYLMPPIAYDDDTWGITVKEKTKSISKYFKERFEVLKIERETPTYFREQIIASYIYKGPVLEWYCRIKTKLENNYELLHSLLPRTGKFYDLGCGYGFATYLLHWSSPSREFIGVDYDEDKIITANNNYKKTAAIHFESADLNNYQLNNCDGIIISDVLHYLLPEQQMAVLEKCFEALNPKGLLIIRDGVKELKERHKGTELTERFSTQIIGFNKTQNALHFIYQEDIIAWAASKNMHFEIIDNTKNTSNILMILSKG